MKLKLGRLIPGARQLNSNRKRQKRQKKDFQIHSKVSTKDYFIEKTFCHARISRVVRGE
jgi:hypothetical protein